MHSDSGLYDVQYATDKTQEPVERQVVRILDELNKSKFPIPNMLPTTEGGVCMLWKSLIIDISLEIKMDGELEFKSASRKLDLEGEAISTELMEGCLSGPGAVDQLMVWFLTSQAKEA